MNNGRPEEVLLLLFPGAVFKAKDDSVKMHTQSSTEDTGPKWLLQISNQYIYFKSLSFLPLIWILESFALDSKESGSCGLFSGSQWLRNMFFGYIYMAR